MSQRDTAPRRISGQKQNTFFGGAAILAVGILVVKLIGMFYKIPLVNIIGEQGNTDFTNAYNIYAVLLTISTAGLPVAVSKLVSEASALGRHNQMRKTFRVSMLLFLSLGLVSFLVMYFKADTLAAMMNDTKAAAGIKALAPAVVCVGCLAALRGYSQGHSNMAPTSVSQIIEALCKLVVGLGLAFWLVKQGKDPDVAAAGAITGVTVGTVVALAYMVLDFLLSRGREDTRGTDRPDSAGSILANILKIAVPITLSSSMVGIVTVIDSSLVQGQLQSALDLTEQASRTLYGNYSGALNIYNLPTSLMAAITASVIPAVSAALLKAETTGGPAGAMVLPDGRVVTGKTSDTLGAASALLLNALKAVGGIGDQFELISAQVLEPVCRLKTQYLGHKNPRLHTDEVLMALTISALTNPLAELAQQQLPKLRGCDAHFTVILSEVDENLLRRLGINVSCEARYETKKLYHK